MLLRIRAGCAHLVTFARSAAGFGSVPCRPRPCQTRRIRNGTKRDRNETRPFATKRDHSQPNATMRNRGSSCKLFSDNRLGIYSRPDARFFAGRVAQLARAAPIDAGWPQSPGHLADAQAREIAPIGPGSRSPSGPAAARLWFSKSVRARIARSILTWGARERARASATKTRRRQAKPSPGRTMKNLENSRLTRTSGRPRAQKPYRPGEAGGIFSYAARVSAMRAYHWGVWTTPEDGSTRMG